MLLALAVTTLGTAATAFVLYRALAPFRRILRGDESVARTLPAQHGHVQARNYLAYLLWIIPGAGGLLLMCLGIGTTLLHLPSEVAHTLATSGLLSLVAAGPLMLVHVVVYATGRPKFLIPPAYRDQPGQVAAWRQRRDRLRTGLPPTDHRVEIVEVPGEDGSQPWLVALCSEPRCDWDAWVDPELAYTDAESALRAKANTHTRDVAEAIVRPLGGP